MTITLNLVILEGAQTHEKETVKFIQASTYILKTSISKRALRLISLLEKSVRIKIIRFSQNLPSVQSLNVFNIS